MKSDKERIVRAIPARNKDNAFRRGKIKSEAPTIRGKRILPKPPMRLGMIRKKIMNSPWKVKLEVYCWAVERTNPKIAFSTLNNIDNPKPIKPPKIPDNIYSPPSITWFVVHLNNKKIELRN